MRVAFATNNAARTPRRVAGHLGGRGGPAAATDVVTSAQAAARLVASKVPPGAAVLVVGGEGLDVALQELGLRPVSSADDEPSAVVQGFARHVGWELLREGAIAVSRGLPWVASNVDRTIPTPRGAAPGNGTLVSVVATPTGRETEVTGKPALGLHHEAMLRTGARHPLVVGDRLDTDIEGANRADVDSLLVLTGITGPAELLRADAPLRPTYLSKDLESGLLAPHPAVQEQDRGWRCRGWRARSVAEGWELEGGGDPVDGLRALCVSVWSAHPADGEASIDQALSRLGW